MIDFKGIPFSEEAKEKIKTSLINYKRFAGVEFVIIRTDDSKQFGITIVQTSFPTGKTLTNEELASRAKDVFSDITPEGWNFRIMSSFADL